MGQHGELRYDVVYFETVRATADDMVPYGKYRSTVLVGVRISCCLENDELRVVVLLSSPQSSSFIDVNVSVPCTKP